MGEIQTFSQAEEFLYQFINLEQGQTPFSKREYRLDRMEYFLKLAGNPHIGAKAVHIAGSKGKGSTAMFLASIFEAHGFTTGLYTSPHVLDVRERIQINRKPVSRAFFVELVRRVERILLEHPAANFPGAMNPTFFEIITLMGFCAFREKNCGFWVIETGLGGRLDATNVIRPCATILTPIELEHEEILGDTIAKIAEEKCGIIKEGIPVFSSRQSDEARTVIKNTAAARKTYVEFLDKIVERLETRVSAAGTDMKLVFRDPDEAFGISAKLSMLGAHQGENAALAVAAACSVLQDFTEKRMKKGLRRARLPGRMEVLQRKPLVIADGAHTPESIRTVVKTTDAICKRPRILLFASVSGKKYKIMADLLAGYFDFIIISTPGLFKKSDPEEVFEYFSTIHADVQFLAKPEKALKQALELSRELSRGAPGHVFPPVIVTGSFYFVSEIRKLVKGK